MFIRIVKLNGFDQDYFNFYVESSIGSSGLYAWPDWEMVAFNVTAEEIGQLLGGN